MNHLLKTVFVVALLGVVAATPNLVTAEDGKEESKPQESELVARLKKIRSLPVSPEEVEKLQQTAEYRDKKYDFTGRVSVSFSRDTKKREREVKKYEKKKKVPIKLFAYVKEEDLKEENPKKRVKYTYKGSADILMIDEKNDVVVKKKVGLRKLCPT